MLGGEGVSGVGVHASITTLNRSRPQWVHWVPRVLPHLTVVLLTFSLLAQGEGGGYGSWRGLMFLCLTVPTF